VSDTSKCQTPYFALLNKELNVQVCDATKVSCMHKSSVHKNITQTKVLNIQLSITNIQHQTNICHITLKSWKAF